MTVSAININAEESIQDIDEVCEVCKFFGKFLMTCDNPLSDFYRGRVHRLGYCQKFKPQPSPVRGET